MNPLQKIYCRCFQGALRLVLPVLPYRTPRVLSSLGEIPGCLARQGITRVLVVTDGFLHLSGMLEPLKQALCRAMGLGELPAEQAPKALIRRIREMNRYMGIPEKLPGIRREDIPQLAAFAAQEANPLYPVPRLMDAAELERFYYDVMEEKQ